MKTVLIDCDGVLADFISATIQSLHSIGITDVHRTLMMHHYDMRKCLSPEQYVIASELWHKTGWCYGIPAYDGAIELLEALRKNARVVCVTKPLLTSSHWMAERYLWLREFQFEDRDIIFASDKSLIEGDLFIDDHPGNVNAWMEKHPNKNAILWSEINGGMSPWFVDTAVKLSSVDSVGGI